jgi:hypothetical protein
MSKQILPSEIKVGDKLRVEQDFGNRGRAMYIGTVYDYEDEYVVFDFDRSHRIDLHPYVMMPNVLIHRLDS